MLAAIIDCLVESELDCLVASLKSDGILCISSDMDLDKMNTTIARFHDRPIVIYGSSSLQTPYDDCPRLWLCCGPEVDHDIDEAIRLNGRASLCQAALARRTQALRCNYRRVTYVDALCFMANAVAAQCVKSMGVGDKAAEILLRHVEKTF